MNGDSYKRLTTLDCHRCGKEYQPTLKKDGTIRKFVFQACSKWCQYALSKGLPKQQYIEPTPCKHCGTMFKAKKEPYGRALFCSRQCFKDHEGIKNPTKRLNTEVNALHRIASRKSKPFLGMIVLKEVAGLVRMQRANKAKRRLGDVITRRCDCCNNTFKELITMGRPSKYCDACRPIVFKESSKEAKRIHKSLRRSRIRGLHYESVDPIKVFERDRWKCHICGTSTPKELRGTHLDKAPELDHIVTLADGGSHTYGNVACACRSCNQKKGARSCGQLRFF